MRKCGSNSLKRQSKHIATQPGKAARRAPFQQTPRIWLCQSAGVAPCKGEGVAERSPRSLGVYQALQRFSSSAFAITLTELSAIAAPATTGLR